jgi:hypothetical protein
MTVGYAIWKENPPIITISGEILPMVCQPGWAVIGAGFVTEKISVSAVIVKLLHAVIMQYGAENTVQAVIFQVTALAWKTAPYVINPPVIRLLRIRYQA